MGGETKLSGPDFSKGIAANDVPDGGMLLGHAGEDAVLLSRRGNDYFAIGATCTHYSGPLAEGLLVGGDEVRCPWHHACFSLRTGEALRAPALNPVPCFRVEASQGKIVVREKIVREEKRTPKAPPASVVIVGGGAAGNAAAEMLRRQGYAGPITMLSADASVPYDRPNLSKDYLAGNAPEEWIPLRPAEFYAEHRIDLKLGTTVASIDPRAHTVTTAGGATIPYGALLLAPGADPVKLDTPGANLPHVHLLRTLSDSRAIIAAASHAKRALVIGASFIGLEVAASLRARKLAVDVVAPEKLPLERVMGAEVGAFVRDVHVSNGVNFHLGKTVTRIEKERAVLSDGTTLEADLVVMGVGVRPSTSLAERAGLKMDRGVSVDAYLETSEPGIFAAGDIARWPDARSGDAIRVEHWVVAQRMGQTAAKNILGARVRFDAVPFFWSNHYDVAIAYVGHAEKWDRVDTAGSVKDRDAALAFRRGSKTLAVLTIGRDAVSLAAELAMEQNDEAKLASLVPPR